MKVSEVTLQYLVDYARIDDPTEVEIRELKEMKKQAVAQIKSYTGLTEEELDQHEDITQALVYAGKQYSVTSVLDVGLEHKMLEIMCCEYKNKDVM